MQLAVILGIRVTHTVGHVHDVEVSVLLLESTHIRDLAVLIPASDALRRAAGQENRNAQQQNLHRTFLETAPSQAQKMPDDRMGHFCYQMIIRQMLPPDENHSVHQQGCRVVGYRVR